MLEAIGGIPTNTSLHTAFTNWQLKLIREFTVHQSHLYYDLQEETAHGLIGRTAKFTAVWGVRTFYILYSG